MGKQYIGSTFDSFLEEEGILEEVEAKAFKRVIALFIEQQLRQEHISKTELAQRMHTSRAAVNRLLDPENTAVTLSSIIRATAVLGKRIQISFIDTGA